MASRTILRGLVALLGVGSIVFGIVPAIAPRRFVVMFGLPALDRPAGSIAIRSVGVRDAVIGAGMLASLGEPSRNSTWLAARALSDSGDAMSCLVALFQDPRNVRLWLLAAIAAAAAVFGWGLLKQLHSLDER